MLAIVMCSCSELSLHLAVLRPCIIKPESALIVLLLRMLLEAAFKGTHVSFRLMPYSWWHWC